MQTCTACIAVVIFLIYPSTCANILAVFHCFEKRTTLRATCTRHHWGLPPALLRELVRLPLVHSAGVLLPVSDWYPSRRWLCHIPSPRRDSDQDWLWAIHHEPVGPSRPFERHYHDYTPEHCLWGIYQLLQKVTLVGFLGFFKRGSFVQVAMGLCVTEFFLLAFIMCT